VDVTVAVIGSGSWGTAVAALATRNARTVLWARRPELAEAIETRRENPEYLPGLHLPDVLRATSSLAEAVGGADVVVMGVPSHGFRAVLAEAAPVLPTDGRLGVPPILSLAKGIEQGTLLRMTEVVAEVLPGRRDDRVGVLTGPNLANEIMLGQPAAAVVAFPDVDLAAQLQQVFMAPTFRVYTNPDVVGCEIAGALKNVMAIAAGMAHGLGYGDNAKAALITRGLAELTRLGVVLGGEPLTFAGLAGMGDLVATCTSDQSRNRRVGIELGRGRRLDEIVGEMQMVAEGVRTTEAALELAGRHDVEMPIAEQVGAVLSGACEPAEVVAALMMRSAKPERHGLDRSPSPVGARGRGAAVGAPRPAVPNSKP
jgi:glycerol-3-phosphate dehydrogenase (NAD(P)+)